jgi:hypothetical protein
MPCSPSNLRAGTGRVSPTGSQNVLRQHPQNAELYQRDRYEIDAVLVWAQLDLVVPELRRPWIADSTV